MDPLNVVVICLDTFRADIVGPGKKLSHVATPALDQLAAESVRFTECFTEPGPTVQVRNGCFTGMRGFPFRNGFYGWHEIPDEQLTVAERLVERGYATGLIGDTPHMFKPNMNHTRGFTTFEHIRGQTSDSWKIGAWDSIAEVFKDYFGDYVPRAPEDSAADLYKEGQVLQYLHNIRDRASEDDWFAPRVFDAASRWVHENAANAPFFLWVDCFETHEVFDPPVSYITPYNDTWEGPKYQQLDHILDPTLHSDMRGASSEGISPKLADYYTACYLGEVTFTDKYVGRLLDEIDRQNLRDSTVVIFFSDHGTELNDHTGFGKRETELHPFNTRLNLMIRHPDSRFADRDVDAFVQNYDLAATILDFAGYPELTESIDGRSVWPLAADQEARGRDFATTAWMSRIAVRDRGWNYVTAWDREDPAPELYDLGADPDELRNVHDQHPDIVGTLRARIENLLGGPLPQTMDQGAVSATAGPYAKPLHATSYAPSFYRARMRWPEPRAIPK